MIRSPSFSCILLALYVATLQHGTADGKGALQSPNIVFILADDLGYGDIEAFGGDLCNIDAPHFDALCEQGMQFTDAHVTNSVCVPSRTSMMTGRYAFRFSRGKQGGPWGGGDGASIPGDTVHCW